MSHRTCLWLVFLLGLTTAITAQGQARSTASAAIQQKVQHVEQNGALPQPDQTPTTFSQQEINDYVASSAVKLPKGVQSVRFSSDPGVITSNARVDFDEVKSGRGSANPLLSVFSGVHDIVVVAHAHGAGHTGYVDVDSVSLDGVDIPRFVLQLFVQKYLQPKYPNLGLNSQFAMPAKIDTAVVGPNQLTITQK
ncbi:MAG TPA: hypothetical protein VMT53_04560 [Terriglobales bacterium]|nr:hypothetical protein [Terriglobales bacterium]